LFVISLLVSKNDAKVLEWNNKLVFKRVQLEAS